MKYLVPLALVLQGCCMDVSGFVVTQRAFYDVVAPEYRRYVDNDPGLSDEKKQNRFDLLDAEQAALTQAEAALQ